MLINYLKSGIRNILHNKVYSLINIAGLVTGISAALLIYLFVAGELNYDTFFPNAERIYRVAVKLDIKGNTAGESPYFTAPVGPALKSSIPEVEEAARISMVKGGIISCDKKQFNIDVVRYADSTFFNVFSYKFQTGKKENALSIPFTAVITSETAGKLFGSLNPVGKEIIFNNSSYRITAVIKDPPANSHLQFKALLSFSSLYHLDGYYMDWNGGCQYVTYLKLNSEKNINAVKEKTKQIFWENINKQNASAGWVVSAVFQQLKDIHLKYEDQDNTRLSNIYIYSAAGILILLIACINYVNLTVAGSLKRSREVGVKKVLGASRYDLIKQFMLESAIIITIALGLSFILFELVGPYYKSFIGDYFSSVPVFNLEYALLFIAGIITLVLLSSFYPSVYLARKSPVAAICDNRIKRTTRYSLKNFLILFQFIISAGMISATGIIYFQLRFLEHRDTGIKKENIFVLNLSSSESSRNYAPLKDEILKLPGVRRVAASSGIPVNGFESNGYLVEGNSSPDIINILYTDKDFLDTYGINLQVGRGFKGNPADDKSYIVNSAFVKKYNFDDPVGKLIRRNDEAYPIIGVTKDFNYASSYEAISPLLIAVRPEAGDYPFLSVLYNSGNTETIIKSIGNIYSQVCPGCLYDYTFLDEAINLTYRKDHNFSSLFLLFSIISIVISVTGLLGLTIFSLTQKRKEIGIRKVLGASVFSIVKLAFKEYSILILAAVILSSAITTYFMKMWLEKFVYKIEISPLIYLATGAIIMALSFITVAVYSVKSAKANPVKSLKYE